jgi:hypothetical protein
MFESTFLLRQQYEAFEGVCVFDGLAFDLALNSHYLNWVMLWTTMSSLASTSPRTYSLNTYNLEMQIGCSQPLQRVENDIT